MVKYDFSGKNCVIAGGASGIGRQVAERAAEAGAAVCIADLNFEGAQAAADELRARGLKATAVRMNAADADSVKEAAAFVRENVGRIDCLVNSIGVGAAPKENDTFYDTYKRQIDVSLMGMFNSCTTFAEDMIAAGGGTIVNICSMAGTIVPHQKRPGRGGEYGLIGYCSAKGATKMMTKAIAMLWADNGIRANSVSPGHVDTPLTAGPHSDPRIRQALLDEVPIHKIAQPDDMAYTVLFLLSEESSYITGQDILVDGGITAR